MQPARGPRSENCTPPAPPIDQRLARPPAEVDPPGPGANGRACVARPFLSIARYTQVSPDTRKYRPIHASIARYTQVSPDTRKYRPIHASIARYTHKYRP